VIGSVQDRSMIAQVQNIVHAGQIVHSSSKHHIDARIRSSHSLGKIQKTVKFEGIFHELYKLSIVIILRVDIKVTCQFDWHILTTSPCQKLVKHFAHFWRIPSQVRKFQRFPIVTGSIWRNVQLPPALFVNLQNILLHECLHTNLKQVI
jgi:hypothetical protein